MMQTIDGLMPSFFAQSDPTGFSTRVSGTWNPAMIVPIVLGAIGYVLLQCGIVKGKQWAWLGIICLVGAIGGSAYFIPPSFENYIAFLFCALAAGGSVGFLTAREPVYAALGFATAVLSISGIMFMQSALFVAAANMIVYAGAIIIIFLFVLMFAQQTTLQTYDVKLTNPYFAASVGAVVLGALAYCLTADGAIPQVKRDPTRLMSEAIPPTRFISEGGNEAISKLKKRESETGTISAAPSTTVGLGRSLYTDYLLAVALAGTILTVAAVGAIALGTKSQGDEA
jgi:NADH-quinone oxidoreductase subunit J